MTAEQILLIVTTENILVVISAGIAAYFGSYLRHKGENLATKEDIAGITKQKDDALQINRLILEQMSQKHSLRLAALDERLEAHQKAWTLWQRLVSTAHDREKSMATVMECQTWFFGHCLYLDKTARDAFYASYNAAMHHADFTRGRQAEDNARVLENWNKIVKAGEALLKAVELPSIASLDSEIPEPKEKQNAKAS